MLLPESGLDKKKSVNQSQEKPLLPVGVNCFLDCPVQEVDGKISLNPSIFPSFDTVVNNNSLFLNGKFILYYVIIIYQRHFTNHSIIFFCSE